MSLAGEGIVSTGEEKTEGERGIVGRREIIGMVGAGAVEITPI